MISRSFLELSISKCRLDITILEKSGIHDYEIPKPPGVRYLRYASELITVIDLVKKG